MEVEKELTTVEGRLSLFMGAIWPRAEGDARGLAAAGQLLIVWDACVEHGDGLVSVHRTLWACVLEAMLEGEMWRLVLGLSRKWRLPFYGLDEEQTARVLGSFCACATSSDLCALAALEFGLLSPHASAHDTVLSMLSSCSLTEIDVVEESLVDVIVIRKCVSAVVKTPLYPLFRRTLLRMMVSSGRECVDSTVRQLRDGGHMFLAGALVLEAQGVDPALRTAGAALAYLARFFA